MKTAYSQTVAANLKPYKVTDAISGTKETRSSSAKFYISKIFQFF